MKKEMIYIGAWGADIQGVNNPEAGDGGIKAFTADSNTYRLISKATPEVNVGSMAVASNGENIYATNERKDLGGIHGNGGGIAAYAVDENGQISFLNEVSSAGAYPCYIVVDSQRRYAFAANHGNHEEVITRSVKTENGTYIAQRFFDEGSIGMFPILNDGSLGECCELKILEGSSELLLFQWTSHPHSVCLDPTEKYLLCADKGCDQIHVFEVDYQQGKLTKIWSQETEKASGPRHIAFHPVLPIFYCNSEQNHTVHAYSFDTATGKITHLDRSVTVSDSYQPKDDPTDIFARNQTADVKVHPSGKYLYVSNRGDDSIACYLLNEQGKMDLIEIVSSEGAIPRSMNFDLSGEHLYVVNQRTGTIVKFKVHAATGKLQSTGIEIQVNNPVNIQFSER